MNISFKKIHLTVFIEYLILICFIYGNVMATWRYRLDNSIPVDTFIYISYGLIILFLCIRIIIYKRRVTVRQGKIIVLLFGYSLFYSLCSGWSSLVSYWLWLILPIILFIPFCWEIRKSRELETLMVRYSNIIIMLSLISLIFYFGGAILGIIPYKIVTIYRSELNTYSIFSYFDLTYTGQTQAIFGMLFQRNTGLFLEGPSWSAFLWLSLFVELFVRERIKYLYCIIILLALITTFSLKGIVFSVIILGMKYMQNSMQIGNKKQIKIAARVLLLPMFILIGFIIILSLFQSKSIYEGGSIVARMEDTIVTFRTWLKYPIFGCGFDNESIIKSLMTGNNLRGNTAGLLEVFALGGIMTGLEYLGGVFLFMLNDKEKKYERVCFTILFLINAFSSSTYNFQISLLIVACGLSYLAPLKLNKDLQLLTDRGNQI